MAEVQERGRRHGLPILEELRTLHFRDRILPAGVPLRGLLGMSGIP